jgi:hypothetical protein
VATMAKGGFQMRGCTRTPVQGELLCRECVLRVVTELSQSEGSEPTAYDELIFAERWSVDPVSGKAPDPKLQKARKNQYECARLDDVRAPMNTMVSFLVVWLKRTKSEKAETSWKSPRVLSPELIADFHERTVRNTATRMSERFQGTTRYILEYGAT